jgi:hypothetical protein
MLGGMSPGGLAGGMFHPPTAAALAMALSADRVVTVSGPFGSCIRAHHMIAAGE